MKSNNTQNHIGLNYLLSENTLSLLTFRVVMFQSVSLESTCRVSFERSVCLLYSNLGLQEQGCENQLHSTFLSFSLAVLGIIVELIIPLEGTKLVGFTWRNLRTTTTDHSS